MLEVGVTNVQKSDCGTDGKQTCEPLSVTEAQTHFAAWAIVSAPLVIGFNFSDVDTVHKHWATITNEDAIEVNQDYFGFSGSSFYQSVEKTSHRPCSWWARSDCSFSSAMSWYKPLSGRDGRQSTMAILLMNNANKTQVGDQARLFVWCSCIRYMFLAHNGIMHSYVLIVPTYDGRIFTFSGHKCQGSRPKLVVRCMTCIPENR